MLPRILYTLFILTFAPVASGSIIRRLRAEISKLAKENRNTKSSLDDARNRIETLEEVGMNLLNKFSRQQDQIDQLAAIVNSTQTTPPPTTVAPEDRFLYNLIEKEELIGLKKISERNPDLPIILHFANGKVARLENTAKTTKIDQLGKDLHQIGKRQDKMETDFNRFVVENEKIMTKLDESMSQIYDFKQYDGSGSDYSGHLLPIVETPGNELQKMQRQVDKLANQLADTKTELSQKANSTDTTLLSLFYSTTKPNNSIERLESSLAESVHTCSNSISASRNRLNRFDKFEEGARISLARNELTNGAIKTQQGIYLTELKRYGEKLSDFESRLLKYGIKLGTLQTDVLNATVMQTKRDNRDLNQDLAIQQQGRDLMRLTQAQANTDIDLTGFKARAVKRMDDGAALPPAMYEGPLRPPPPVENQFRGRRRQKRRYRRQPDPLHFPKRPKTGYVIFTNDRRPAVRRANPQMTIPEVSSRMGQEWRAMTAAERRPYHARSNRDRTRYHDQRADWMQHMWQGQQWHRPPDIPV